MATVLPAIAVSPKPLTDACTKILAKQNTAPCTADGIPVFRISPVSLRENRSLGDSGYARFSFISRRNTISAESILEMPVAVATPATPMRNTITKNRLSPTLATPEKTKAKKGYRLSPPCTKNGGAEIVKQKKRIAEHINPQIQHSVPKNTVRRLDQPQKRFCEELPQNHSERTDKNGQHDRRFYCGRNFVLAVLADQIGNEYICPDRQTGGHRNDQRNDFRIGSDCGKRIFVSEIADDRSVGGVEELLKNTAERNGKCKQQQLFDKRSVEHIRLCVFEFHVLNSLIGS